MNVKEGDIYVLSSKSKNALAKVIYTSNYFKDVILIKLYLSPVEADKVPSNYLVDSDFKLIYTGKDSVKKSTWNLIASQQVSADEKKLTKRIVAGDVWVGDDMIGKASDSDLEKLPKMLTLGYKLIDKKVSKL